MIKNFTLYFIAIFIAIFSFGSCARDFLSGGGSNSQTTDINEARAIFEATANDLREVDFGLSFGHPATKSSDKWVITPQWGKSLVVTSGKFTIFEIPLGGDVKKYATSQFRKDGLLYGTGVKKVTTKLILKRNNEMDKYLYFIVTMVGQNDDKNETAINYTNNRSFTGYIFISNLDGLCVDIYDCKSGVGIRAHFEDTRTKSANKDERVDGAIVQLFSTAAMAYGYGEDRISSGGGGSIGGGGGSCPKSCFYCKGAGVSCSQCNSCTPVIVHGCNVCGSQNGCCCCLVCRHYPCTCDPIFACPKCKNPFCLGFCENSGGGEPEKPKEPDYTKTPTTPKKPIDGDCFCVRGTPGQGISGGLYGANRGKNRKHKGVDLGVSTGDPIYAIYSGKITRLVTSQPNRVPKDERVDSLHDVDGYLKTYKGDKDAGGNRIRIYSDINGTTFETTYMHLNQGNSKNLSVGQEITKGDIIGYTGISGNSYPDSPVLHIQMNKKKSYKDSFDPTIFLTFVNKIGTCSSPNCINK